LFPLTELANPAHSVFWPTKVTHYASEENISLYWNVVHLLEIEPSFHGIIFAARATSLIKYSRIAKWSDFACGEKRQHAQKGVTPTICSKRNARRFFCKHTTHEQYREIAGATIDAGAPNTVFSDVHFLAIRDEKLMPSACHLKSHRNGDIFPDSLLG
jgi:hypothetical protein